MFTVLLTSLATYTNLAPPLLVVPNSNQKHTATSSKNTKDNPNNAKIKHNLTQNKELMKMKPCLVVLETFLAFLNNLEMEQVFFYFMLIFVLNITYIDIFNKKIDFGCSKNVFNIS